MAVHSSAIVGFTSRRATAWRWRKIVSFVARMAQMRRTRHMLAQLDARMLADIGVSRAEAEHEINRAPWDFGGSAGRRLF